MQGVIPANPLLEDDKETTNTNFNKQQVKIYIKSNHYGRLHETFFVKIEGSLNRMKLTLKGEVIKTEIDKHIYKEEYTG